LRYSIGVTENNYRLLLRVYMASPATNHPSYPNQDSGQVVDIAGHNAFMDNSLQGVVLFQRNRLNYINRTVTDILGYTPEDLYGLSPRDCLRFVHPEDRPTMQVRLEQRQQGNNNPARYFLRMFHKNGGLRWLEVISSQGIYAGEKTIQFCFTDATIHFLHQEREAFYRALAETTQDMVFVIDRNDRLIYVNPAAAAKLGKTPEEILNQPREAFSEGHMGKLRTESLKKVFQTGEPITIESGFPASNGMVWIHVHLTPLKSEDGKTYAVMGVARDITERRAIEQALQESEEGYRLLLETIPIGVGISDWDGKIHFVNPAACQITGYSMEELSQIRTKALYANLELQTEILHRLRHEGCVNDIKMAIRHKSGKNITVLSNSCVIHIGGKEQILSTIKDITETERINKELEELNNRFRATFEQAAVGIAHVDLNGRFVRVNQRFCQIVGYHAEELAQRTFQEITHPEDVEEEAVAQLLAGEIKTYTIEKRYLRKRGQPVWVQVTTSLVRDSDGQPSYFIGVVEDISQRKKAEAALEESRKNLEKQVAERTANLRNLTQKLVNAQEAERKRIARELHDDIGSSLLGLHLSLGTLMDQVPSKASNLFEQLNKLSEQVSQIIQRVRSISRLLRPAILEVGGLHLSLEQLCATISQQASLPIHYIGKPVTLSEEQALCLYRVAQEALTNALKHANASHVNVKLICKGSWVTLIIQDDGIGLNSKTRRNGIGLLDMKERLTALNGHLRLYSSPRGTRLTATLPLQHE